MSGPGAVVWLTGLPRAGKSTLARAIRERLVAREVPVVLLDGDEVRRALVPSHGYDEPGRAAFYETLARLAALVAAQGLIVLVPATAHRRAFRAVARATVDHFVEVYVTTPVEACRQREGSSFYSDEAIRNALPGAGIEYEAPEKPEIRARGGKDAAAVDAVLQALGELAWPLLSASLTREEETP